MLKKCLKHDLKAVWKYWWIIAILTVVMGAVGGVCIRISTEISMMFYGDIWAELISLPFGAAGMICMLGVFASILATLILVYIRYYKNFFSDEGYLTFTLPVKRSTLFASKIISAALWYSAQTILIALSMLMVSFIVEPEMFFNGILAEIKYIVEMAGSSETFVSVVIEKIFLWLVYPIELVVLSLLSMLFDTLLVHFCITLGSVIVKRAKVIVGVGIYVGVTSVITVLAQTLAWFAVIFLLMGVGLMIETAMSALQLFFIFAAALAFICVMIAVPVCALYLISLHLIERRLNLS